MKALNSMAVILFLLFNSLVAEAQQNEFGAYAVTVDDITKTISKGPQPGFKVDVYQAEKKEIENQWSRAIRQDTKSKVENLNNELFITGTILKSISVKPVNVYSIINQYEDHIELNAFFEDSIFLTKEKSETEYLAARKFLRDFAVEAYREAVQKEVKAEEKKLSDLESDLDNLAKENDKLHKRINEKERSISSDKDKIATSELDQERVRKLVQAQKGEVSNVKATGSSEEVVKAAEKKLKELESEVSKLEKQEDNLHKDIDKSQAEIREAQRNISDNEHSMELKRGEITKQKEVVYARQKKLESIK